ncbi:hypothetical protein [Chroococcidiopsis sp. SAG 2025]|uniref:hypothetical protein n=1 Tax=Chroococcidiopsis sp. SAG 2025 TaxID=171389 RepID=UPI00293721C7|nr:hypothetical protein [Chroococcidiopsis sp. SAG 2025]
MDKYCAAAGGGGTLVLPYSIVFNNHAFSGSLLLFSFLLFITQTARSKKCRDRRIFIAFAGSTDITMFALIPLYSILLFNQKHQAKLAFILACIPMILLYIWLNFYTSGSIIPPAMNAKLWDYPGSYFGTGKSFRIGRTRFTKFSYLCFSYARW